MTNSKLHKPPQIQLKNTGGVNFYIFFVFVRKYIILALRKLIFNPDKQGHRSEKRKNILGHVRNKPLGRAGYP
jgi:hypothetical protein